MATVRQLLDEKGHNVITVGADDTVFDAVRKMAEENIGSLIVCEGSKVIGIITERHYARNVFLEGRALPNTRVGDVMETPVLFVRPGLTAEECMADAKRNRDTRNRMKASGGQPSKRRRSMPLRAD